MTRRKPRGLTEEERKLWQRVRETAVPLRPQAPAPLSGQPAKLAPPAPADEQHAPEVAPLQPFRLGEKAGETALGDRFGAGFRDVPVARPLNMDRKEFMRLRRGKLAPEARIDLHGMTLTEARDALAGFVMQAQAKGLRLVLVITGKGRESGGDFGPIPERRGVLRQQVPLWLAAAPLSLAVQQVEEAHRRHGGGGALYVYLRRRR